MARATNVALPYGRATFVALTRARALDLIRMRVPADAGTARLRGGSPEMYDEDEDTATYAVVVNDEEQYSIWLAHREPPAGWRRTGVEGTRAECLEHIDRVWTDLRPKSLREWMASQESGAHRDDQMVSG